jgi:hypothetical protein
MTKECREAREFWITTLGPMFQHDIKYQMPSPSEIKEYGYIHVREVQND